MSMVIEGDFSASDAKFAIIVARFQYSGDVKWMQ